ERFIAATLISIAIPCAASQAMIIGLVGAEGGQYVAIVYGTLFVVWLVLGLILNQAVRGFSPELLIEIPPYRRPSWRAVLTKLWMRTYGFLREALPIILLAIFAIGILYNLGVFDAIANFTAPVVSGLFGLPKEGVVAIVVGFLRKDVAIGLLSPLSLSAGQLVVRDGFAFGCQFYMFQAFFLGQASSPMLKGTGMRALALLKKTNLYHFENPWLNSLIGFQTLVVGQYGAKRDKEAGGQ
ncbi:unnamed protein product, partial [marine sediment metagenome]